MAQSLILPEEVVRLNDFVLVRHRQGNDRMADSKEIVHEMKNRPFQQNYSMI